MSFILNKISEYIKITNNNNTNNIKDNGGDILQCPPRNCTKSILYNKEFHEIIEKILSYKKDDVEEQGVNDSIYNEDNDKKKKDLAQKNINYRKVYSLLRDIEQYIYIDYFKSDTIEISREIKRDLLKLWSFLLSNYKCVPNAKANIRLDYILKISTRYEFDLIHIYRKAAPIDKNELSIMEEYRKQLLLTLKYAMKYLKRKNKHYHLMYKQLATNILSIAFFRIPEIGGSLLDRACYECSKQNEKQKFRRNSLNRLLYMIDSPTSDELSSPNITHSTIDTISDSDIRFIDTLPINASTNIDVNNCNNNLNDNNNNNISQRSSPYNTSEFSDISMNGNGWKSNALKTLETLKNRQKLADRAAVSISSYFLDFNPSLFMWTECYQPILSDNIYNIIGILRKEENFNYFFLAYLKHICETVHGDIKWSLVPGYWPLIKTFITYLMNKNAPHSITCINIMNILIENQPLLTLMIQILLKTTKLHNIMAINQTLDVLNKWFKQLTDNNEANEKPIIILPDTINFTELISAISLLLESMHFQVLIKILWFIFSNIDHFPSKYRHDILYEKILNQNFNRLFLHWCPEVRKVFHYLLVYKLYRKGVIVEEKPKSRISYYANSLRHRMSNTISFVSTAADSTISLFRSSGNKLTVSDPKLDACIEICCHLNKDDLNDDNSLIARRNQLIDMERNTPSNKYSSKSIIEYEKCISSCTRLQQFCTLGGVITPELYFDIVLPTDDIMMSSM